MLNEEGTPCQNGGVCLDKVGGYSCICTGNFTGLNCSEEGECAANLVVELIYHHIYSSSIVGVALW